MNTISVSPIKLNRAAFSGSADLKKSDSTPVNTDSKRYELPGYNVSFGALIKEYDRNPGVLLDRMQRKEIEDLATSAMAYSGDPEGEDKKLVQKMFDKYGDNISAVQYFAHFALIQDTKDKSTNKQNANYLNTILDTINTHFADDKKKRKEYLNAMISLKNSDGNCLAHAYTKSLEMTSAGLLPHLFESLSDFPELQVKVLEQKNKYGKTVGQTVAYSHSDDGNAINDTLYTLAARTKKISRQQSIYLLTANEKVLNDHNKDVLAALKSKDCICLESPQKKTNGVSNAAEKISDSGNAAGKTIQLIDISGSNRSEDRKYEHAVNETSYGNPSINFSAFEVIDG